MARTHGARTDVEGAILVTGSCGYVGTELIGSLVDASSSVVALYRKRQPLSRTGVFPVCLDLSTVDLLAAPLRGVSTVVHLAWQPRPATAPGFDTAAFCKDRAAGQLSANERALDTVLRAMEHSGTPRIIFLSHLGTRYQSQVPFLQEKYRAEWAVLNSKIPERHIVRAGTIYGRAYGGKDPFIEAILRLLRIPGVYPLPARLQALRPVFVADLCRAITALAQAPAALAPCGLVHEAIGPRAYPLAEIYRIVSEAFRGQKAGVGLSGPLGRLAMRLLERDRQLQPGWSLHDWLDVLEESQALGAAPEHHRDATLALRAYLTTTLEEVLTPSYPRIHAMPSAPTL